MIHEKTASVKNAPPGRILGDSGRQGTVLCLPPVSLVCWEKVKNKRNAPEKDVPFCAFVVF